jgi:hypothetical protein
MGRNDQLRFKGGGGVSSSAFPQDAKNSAAANMTAVNSASGRRKQANGEKEAKILPLLPLHFSKYFIDISSNQIKLRYKTVYYTVYPDSVNLSI